MSRCFPFPPPGYENKAAPNNLNSIIKEKEKHKQKRHKDKKDKEKNERSERKDRERSDGKREKDDKDRKKKKHKDKKDKNKDKRKSSEERDIVELAHNENGKKPGPDNRPDVGAQEHYKNTIGPSENRNGKKPGPDNISFDVVHSRRISIEMGKRIRIDDGATDKNKKIVGLLENQNGEKPGPTNTQCELARESRILAELGKRVRNDDVAKDNCHSIMASGQSLRNGSGDNWVGNFSGEKRIKVGNGSCQVNIVEKRSEGKEKNENRDKNRTEDKKRKEEVTGKIKETIKQRTSRDNLPDSCADKPDDLLNESWDRRGKLPKLKEPVLNCSLNGNATQPDNMLRPAISSHHVGQNGNCPHPSQKNTTPLITGNRAVITNQAVNGKLSSSQSMLKNVRNMEPGRTPNNSTPDHLLARVNNRALSDGLISSNPLVDNSRKKAIRSDTDKTLGESRRSDNEEFSTTGVLEGKNDISSRPLIKPPRERECAFTKKAPHPDLKYLSRILTVPVLDSPRFDDDDQNWLFDRKREKKPESGPSEIESAHRVWAEAIRLESVDVTVLPYVVPY